MKKLHELLEQTFQACRMKTQFVEREHDGDTKSAVVTARIPKEWGSSCFHPCLSVYTCGVLHPADRGIPMWQRGVPPPGQQGAGVIPPSGQGGTPIWPTGDTPLSGLDGVPPHQETEQQNEHLLCSSQYASCIH